MSVCTECKEDAFVTDLAAGDVVCSACGLVQQSRIIDERPLFKNMNQDPGIQELFRPLRGSMTAQREHDLQEASSFLSEHLARHPFAGISADTINHALTLYAAYLDKSSSATKQPVRGPARDRLLIATLLQAAANTQCDVDPRQFASVFDTSTGQIALATNLLSRTFESERMLCKVYVANIPSLVRSYVSRLSFPRSMRMEAMDTASKIEQLVGHRRELKTWRPNSLAAAIVWHTVATHRRRAGVPSQDCIARVTCISKTTFIQAEKVIKETLSK